MHVLIHVFKWLPCNSGVATKLLENDAPANARDKDKVLPLTIALNDRNDEMCALLLAYMPNEL